MGIADDVTAGLNAIYRMREVQNQPQDIFYNNMINRSKAGMADIDYQNYPETAQAELAYKKLLPPYLQTQTNLLGEQAKYYGPKAKADIENQEWINRGLAAVFPYLVPEKKLALKKSDLANQLSEQNLILNPYKVAGGYFSGLGKYNASQHQMDPRYIMTRILNSPELLSMIQTNSATAKDVAQLIGRLASDAASGNGSMSNANAAPVPLIDPSKPLAGMASPLPVQQSIPAGNQSTTPAFQLSDDDVAQLQKASADTLVRKTNTAQGLNQQRFANTLDNLFEKADPLVPSVIKFSGIAGNIQERINKLGGSNSKEWGDYLKFTRRVVPAIATELLRTAGANATDTQKQMFLDLANPNYWDTSPQQALDQWNFMKSLYYEAIDPSVAQTLSETQKQLRTGVKSVKPVVRNSQPKAKKTAPLGMVRVVAPDGRTGSIPTADLEKALKAGYKKED